MGHLCFYDSKIDKVLLFGGQRSGDKYKQTNQRLMMNDICIYNFKQGVIQEQILFSESSVPSRIYACGFKIDQRIYVIGGMGNNG